MEKRFFLEIIFEKRSFMEIIIWKYLIRKQKPKKKFKCHFNFLKFTIIKTKSFSQYYFFFLN